MPKIVDHDERRRELANAAIRVLGRVGLEAATNKAVAIECGWSTGVVQHYFHSKDELLYAALRELEGANLERFEAAQHAVNGFDAICAAVAATAGGNADETRVWIAFLSRASADPAIAMTMRHGIRMWTERWAELLRRGQGDGSVAEDLDADETAVELYALVNGLRIGSVFRADRSSRLRRGDLSFLDHLRPTAHADQFPNTYEQR